MPANSLVLRLAAATGYGEIKQRSSKSFGCFPPDTYVHLFEAHRHAHDAREQLEAEYGEMLGAADA
jgi:hypothetical protein